jgi:hypothetical protein
LTTGAFNDPLSVLDVPIGAVPNGLVTISIPYAKHDAAWGPLQFRFWKTPDLAYASMWVIPYSSAGNPPYSIIRYFNITIVVHRLPRGGF